MFGSEDDDLVRIDEGEALSCFVEGSAAGGPADLEHSIEEALSEEAKRPVVATGDRARRPVVPQCPLGPFRETRFEGPEGRSEHIEGVPPFVGLLVHISANRPIALENAQDVRLLEQPGLCGELARAHVKHSTVAMFVSTRASRGPPSIPISGGCFGGFGTKWTSWSGQFGWTRGTGNSSNDQCSRSCHPLIWPSRDAVA